jgi:hypothetical protein
MLFSNLPLARWPPSMPNCCPWPCVASLPWLDEEPNAGILPLTGLGRGDGKHFVGRRSRLVIRVPMHRSTSADYLSGRTLDLGDASLGIGRSTLRPLLPATEVVHSHFVSFGMEDEIEFLGACRAALTQRGIGGEPVTGRAQRLAATTGTGVWLFTDAARPQACRVRGHPGNRPGPAPPARLWQLHTAQICRRRRRITTKH